MNFGSVFCKFHTVSLKVNMDQRLKRNDFKKSYLNAKI